MTFGKLAETEQLAVINLTQKLSPYPGEYGGPNVLEPPISSTTNSRIPAPKTAEHT